MITKKNWKALRATSPETNRWFFSKEITDELFLKVVNDYRTDNNIPLLTDIMEFPPAQLRADPVFNSAARLVRIASRQHEKLIQCINTYFRDITKFKLGEQKNCLNIYQDTEDGADVGKAQYSPLTMPMVIDGKVILTEFTNISVRMQNKSSQLLEPMSNCCFQRSAEYIDQWYAGYKADLEHTHKRKKWANPYKTLKVRREIPLVRWITNNSNLKALGLSDDKIRDLAEKVKNEFLPLKLSITETMEEVAEVYNKGPGSCMSSSSGRGWSGNGIIRACGGIPSQTFHPCAWYFYAPFCKVAYIRQNGTITARAILWQLEGGGWGYTRIYTSTSSAKKKFPEALSEFGASKISEFSKEVLWEETSFILPSNKGGAIPIPYFDSVPNVFSYARTGDGAQVTLMGKTKGKARKATRNATSMGSQQGYININSFGSVPCSHCGSQISGTGIVSLLGNAYCSVIHAEASGLVRARRSDGEFDWVSSAGVVTLANGAEHFTTGQAALDNGCVLSCRVSPTGAQYANNRQPIFVRTKSKNLIRVCGKAHHSLTKPSYRLPKVNVSAQSSLTITI